MKRHLPDIIFLACLLLAFGVYFPGTSGYFVFDDSLNIVENTHIQIQSLDFLTLKQTAVSGGAGIFGRPLSVISFAFNYYLTGLNPFYFKLTNIVIHLLNGSCVYLLTYLLLDTQRRRDMATPDRNITRWISLAVAAAWLLHPLNLTGVLYVVQRMASLAALFTFLGLVAYVHGRRRMLDGQSGWGWIFAGFALFTPLAIFSKENGAMLPTFMLLIELVFFRFHTPSIAAKRLLMALFGLSVLLPLAAMLVYTALNPAWITGGYSIRNFTLPERLMTEARIVWFYIRLILAPDIAQLGMYHDDILISKSLLEPLTTLFASVGILLLGIVALMSTKRYPIAAFGILFFLVGHSMESTAIALELVHEHRNYLPMYGLLLTLFYYLLYPLRHIRSLSARRGLAVLFILMLASITFLRATQWGDAVEMEKKEVAHHPDSIRANIAIGAFYAAMPALSQADAEDFYQRAYTYYAKAAELDPADTLGLFGLIALNSKHAIAIEETWVKALAGRLERYPFAPNTGNSIVSLEKCVAKGDCKLPPEIMVSLIQAALRNPTLRGGAKAQVLFAWSDFLFRVQNQRDAAAVEAQRAVDAYPQDLDNQITLINMLINMGKPVEAQNRVVQARLLDKRRVYTSALDEREKWIATLRKTQH